MSMPSLEASSLRVAAMICANAHDQARGLQGLLTVEFGCGILVHGIALHRTHDGRTSLKLPERIWHVDDSARARFEKAVFAWLAQLPQFDGSSR